MNRSCLWGIVFVIICSFLSMPAHGMSVWDQGWIFGTDGALELGTDEWAQSITTGITGQLTQIEIQFHAGVPTEPPALNLSIYDGGNPISGSALFTEQRFITDADLIGQYLFAWDLSSAGLSFNAGNVFTFVLQAEGVGYNIAGNEEGTEEGYIGGILFRNRVEYPELSDIAFRTYVKPTGGVIIGQRRWAGGNGHTYAIVSYPNQNWISALTDVSSTLPGYHLATITSQAEQDFIWNFFLDTTGGSHDWWLGGFQDIEPEIDPAAGWKWVTDEEWNYTNWSGGEPNNANGIEDHLAFESWGQWNDCCTTEGNVVLGGYIAEYDSDDFPWELFLPAIQSGAQQK